MNKVMAYGSVVRQKGLMHIQVGDRVKDVAERFSISPKTVQRIRKLCEATGDVVKHNTEVGHSALGRRSS